MIITTTYIAENNKDRRALLLMHATLQESGMDITLEDETETHKASLELKESRRSRRSNQETKVPQE